MADKQNFSSKLVNQPCWNEGVTTVEYLLCVHKSTIIQQQASPNEMIEDKNYLTL